MISIIVCSISKDKLEIFKENLACTIGMPYEVIAIDNKEDNLPITTVYNIGAKQAKYKYLCFAHEDIAFHTNNWGDIIVAQLAIKETGVIGFAGSSLKTKTISGWVTDKKYTYLNVIQTRKELVKNNTKNIFEQVITIDGLCMFSRKEVWEKNNFDDIHFDGFHLYDMDFSFSVSRKYKNFVCFGIDIEHFSKGSYNNEWLKYTLVFHKKWEEYLPSSVKELSSKELERAELKVHENILYFVLKKRLTPKEYIKELKDDFLAKNKNFINAAYIKYMYRKYTK